MKRAFALACLLRFGCANWSEESARYASYGEFVIARGPTTSV
jgi:hypothetical protein